MDSQTSLAVAIAAAGGIRTFTERLGITAQAVSAWRKGRVPATRCRAIEALAGGKVTCFDLRPDVFGADPARPQEEPS